MELGEHQSAMSDLDIAVRLRKEYAPGFANRALALTRLGRDEEAEEDITKAASLGYDVTALRQKIDSLKGAR
jgi:Flp pilus assembly protein TadD